MMSIGAIGTPFFFIVSSLKAALQELCGAPP